MTHRCMECFVLQALQRIPDFRSEDRYGLGRCEGFTSSRFQCVLLRSFPHGQQLLTHAHRFGASCPGFAGGSGMGLPFASIGPLVLMIVLVVRNFR